MMETLNEEANSLLDTFQIYLQTLISQSLDSNFVKEIVKEQGLRKFNIQTILIHSQVTLFLFRWIFFNQHCGYWRSLDSAKKRNVEGNNQNEKTISGLCIFFRQTPEGHGYSPFAVQELLEAHPGLELRCVTSGDKSCDTCGGRNPTRSFEFQPLTYSFDTLDIMEGKPSAKVCFISCMLLDM